MDGRKYLAIVLLVCGMMDVAVAMGGIRFPRKNIISLTDLKNVSSTWYTMLYGGALPEDGVLYNSQLTHTWQSSNQLLIEISGITCLSNCGDIFSLNSQDCIREQPYPLFTVYQTDKAAFVDADGYYHVFVSSNPDEYLIMFTCFDGAPDIKNRVCDVHNTQISMTVKNQRPDSLPLMAAVNDLKRNTDGAIAFDSNIPTSLGVPFQFFYTMLEDLNC